mgnify:CR=1 FL=1
MNKVELTKSVATRIGATQKDAAVYVDAVIESIKDGMIEDGKVQIVGFGTFEVKEPLPHKKLRKRKSFGRSCQKS